ncbi:MAG: hypothetical protein CSA72_09340 [Rhodobacterales bacterium]|nr:MAG: hypothetical protein CSA72_09340 [Rhodobacterales bacterium]
MKKTIVTALMLSPLAAEAGSYCELDDSVMFSCTFKGGAKTVEVCDAIWLDGDMAAYGFVGSDGTVEKEIITDKASIAFTPWNGMGAETEAVSFYGGEDYTYEVWWAEGLHSADGGIIVAKGAEVIATLSCDPGSVRSNLFGLIAMIEDATVSP